MGVARNTLYNLAGAAVPIVLALVTVPLYLHRIGEARYGVLAIVWLLLGYFGSFDLGLSRAAANAIARLRDASSDEREQVFWTACVLNTGLGVVAGIVFYFAGTSILETWFKISKPLHVEFAAALPWIAAAVPVATVTAALTGALEGLQCFRTVNLIQSFGTALFQLAPLLTAVWIGPQLQFVIPAAVIARVLAALPLVPVVRSALPLTQPPRLRWRRIRSLTAYGSWVAVTNLVGPILHVFDRFLIGIVLGASAVADYVVPFQLVNRAQIVPAALSRALFPHLSTVDAAQSKQVAGESVVTLAAATTPLIVLGLLAIWPFLQVWVGKPFADRAAPVGEILLLGVWINGLAFVPFALLQARGRPDVVARFHLLELVPFAVVLWFGLHRFGIIAAAAAWTLRVAVDAALLFNAARLRAAVARPLLPAAALITAAGSCALLIPRAFDVVRLYAGVPLCVLSCVWALAASDHVRAFVRRFSRHRKPRQGEES